MYQPAHGRFVVPDSAALLGELCAAVPATLVSNGSDGFWTSVLPMIHVPGTSENGASPDPGLLRGHLARANGHWRELLSQSAAIAIFVGPDAYVSPSYYQEKRLTGKAVPTWNYSTAVVHGTITVHPDQEWLLPHVRALVDRHEARRAHPWSIDDPPDGYIEMMARAIVGLELRIERIEAKRKLSQNRSAEDIAGVIEALGDGTPLERLVAQDVREG